MGNINDRVSRQTISGSTDRKPAAVGSRPKTAPKKTKSKNVKVKPVVKMSAAKTSRKNNA